MILRGPAGFLQLITCVYSGTSQVLDQPPEQVVQVDVEHVPIVGDGLDWKNKDRLVIIRNNIE